MPMCAYGKSKKVKAGSTVEETNVKTVDVTLSNRGTQLQEVGSEYVECEWVGESTLVRSVKLFWIYA
jgi:hypothetical protein